MDRDGQGWGAEVGEEIKKEKENESSAKQVKVRGRDRSSHTERETKKKKLGKESMKGIWFFGVLF